MVVVRENRDLSFLEVSDRIEIPIICVHPQLGVTFNKFVRWKGRPHGNSAHFFYLRTYWTTFNRSLPPYVKLNSGFHVLLSRITFYFRLPLTFSVLHLFDERAVAKSVRRIFESDHVVLCNHIRTCKTFACINKHGTELGQSLLKST